MAFDPEKDKVIDSWEHEDGLEVSLHVYDKGAVKLQIGPRYYTNKDGERKRSKGGRLTMEELEWIVSLNPLMQDKAMEEKA